MNRTSLRVGATHSDCKKGKARHWSAQAKVDSTCDSEQEQGRGETRNTVGTECGRETVRLGDSPQPGRRQHTRAHTHSGERS